jgi:hypothetical protein
MKNGGPFGPPFSMRVVQAAINYPRTFATVVGQTVEVAASCHVVAGE